MKALLIFLSTFGAGAALGFAVKESITSKQIAELKNALFLLSPALFRWMVK
jgi:hypothetical protein